MFRTVHLCVHVEASRELQVTCSSTLYLLPSDRVMGSGFKA